MVETKYGKYIGTNPNDPLDLGGKQLFLKEVNLH